MTSREFFYLVSNMRSAQTEYFKTKDRAVFRAARKLENEVDAEIRRVKEILRDNDHSSEMTLPPH